MKRRALLVLAAAVAGCSSQPDATGIAPPVQNDPAGNASKIAQLVSQQCFGRASNVAEFEAALKASGWGTKRTQTADPTNPLEVDVWSFPAGTLIRGELVRGAVWVCSVSTKGRLSSDLVQLRSALSRVADNRPDKAGEWWWNARQHRFHMDLAVQQDGSLFVNVEDYRLPWWQSILG